MDPGYDFRSKAIRSESLMSSAVGAFTSKEEPKASRSFLNKFLSYVTKLRPDQELLAHRCSRSHGQQSPSSSRPAIPDPLEL